MRRGRLWPRVLAVAAWLPLTACVTLGGRPVEAEGREGAELRTLVLMLDGVPYEVMDSLWRAGHFRGFRAPSRLVSPFPSLTNVAFPRMWGESPPPGYEDRYFDREQNRLRGGLLEHMLQPGEHSSFHRHVEVEADGVTAALAYLLPGPIARKELADFRHELERRAVRDSTVVAYLMSTDALAHQAGREELVEFLLEMEALLEATRERYGPDLRILVFSDHGNDFVPTRRVPLEDALRQAGFRAARRIEADHDVVLPRFGLVGSAFLYTAPAAEARLAAALQEVPGVDLILFEDEAGRIHVWSRRGRAEVEAREGRYRYAPVTGDPLGFGPVLERLRASGELDSAGFAPDSAWLRESLGTPYVDALRRIELALRGAVRHPASVLVSFEPGYHYGDPAADALVQMKGTHGSLGTRSSLAFFMSTHIEAPPVLRSDDVARFLPRSP
jgi:hypothetical protein